MNAVSLPITRRCGPVARALLPLTVATLLVGIPTPQPGTAAETTDPANLLQGLKVQAPEVPQGITWLNSPPVTMKRLRGKVVLIDFWEYTCVNCIRTFPYLVEWDRRYRNKGLVIVGVHTPEFAFARELENVRRAATEFGFKYPIAVDSDYKIWNSYGNRYWPAKYLIDRKGVIRDFHFGEGSYGNTEAKIQSLLKEINPKVALPAIMEPVRPEDRPGAVCYRVTHELYGGSLRGELGSTLSDALYQDPGNHADGVIYPHGAWTQGKEVLLHTRQTDTPEDYIALKYHALGVNSVLRPERDKPIRLYVEHDGQPVAKEDKGDDIRYEADGKSYILVDQPRMYYLIKNAKFAQRELKLLTADEGLGLYSFTFTSCEAEPRSSEPARPESAP
jgi:thiol-disulfide isomerase/thioredoxin